MRGFKVYPIDTASGPVQPSGRRDLYTLYLLTGPHHLHRADQEIVRAGTRLYLGTPPLADAPATVATRQTGYCCLFTEAFVGECAAAEHPEAVPRALLDYKSTYSCLLPAEAAAYLTVLFEHMLREQQTTYVFRQELVRSYLHLVLHEARRLQQPSPSRHFRYYCRQPGVPGALTSGRGHRQPRRR